MKLPTVKQACKALGITHLRKSGAYYSGEYYIGMYGTAPVRIIVGTYVFEDGVFLDITTIQKPCINIYFNFSALTKRMRAEVTFNTHM